MATMEELQARLTRLQDIQAIKKLQHIYGYYQDYSQWQKIVDLFTASDPSVEEADRGIYRGQTGIRRYYLELLGGKEPRPGWLSIMFQLQGVVTVAEDGCNAKGRWYGMGMEAKPTVSLHEGDLRQTWISGTYENEYVKENGIWKFKRVYFNLTFRPPFEEGWLKCPVIGQNGPDQKIKPDAPSAHYLPYPSGYQVPFSFQHPISGNKH
jgi:hypothetical protein